MSRWVKAKALPKKLSLQQAVEAAYPAEVDRCEHALRRGLPVLVECDKELSPYFYRVIRQRLRQVGISCDYLDGRPSPGADDTVEAGRPMIAAILRQLREAVRGPSGNRVVVLPHLDVLAGGAVTLEAREIIPLLYENANIVWLGFEDPSFAVPPAIERLFPHRETIAGLRRQRLRHLVTRAEAEMLGGRLDTFRLFECVSGVNAVRLRRVLEALAQDGEGDPEQILAQVRAFTLRGSAVPDVDLQRDIGGYTAVKTRIEREIVDVLRRRDELADDRAIAHLESLLPRGFLIWGPPGTGKSLFAQALAHSIGAAVHTASGPELRARWVRAPSETFRQLFVQARRTAPSLLVIDEIDAFASTRGAAAGGLEHAMIKQLLSELDALRPEEMVFVVGIARRAQHLEPTLLRPGRFEFQVHVPYPDADDRRAILAIHDEKLHLRLTDEAFDHTVRSTAGMVEGTGDARYSGDHLQALCRQIARRRLRQGMTGPTDRADVDAALEAYLERPAFTPEEQRAIASHEAGHAICALSCPQAPTIDRISIRGDLGALGYVRYESSSQRYIVTRGQLLDLICTLYGGREAEAMLLDDISAGAGQDLRRATDMARVLVEDLGMGGDDVGSITYDTRGGNHPGLAESTRATLDAAVRRILDEQQARARALLEQHRSAVEQLRDALVERKVLDADALAEVLPRLFQASPKAERVPPSKKGTRRKTSRASPSKRSKQGKATTTKEKTSRGKRPSPTAVAEPRRERVGTKVR